MHLSEASIDDIVNELRSRQLYFTLTVVDHVSGNGSCQVYADEMYGRKHSPAVIAADLCDGIQTCLNEVETVDPSMEGAAEIALDLSMRMNADFRRG